jgi:hypothetical protein
VNDETNDVDLGEPWNGIVGEVGYYEGSPRTAIAVYLAGIARRFAEMDAEKADLYRMLGIIRAAKVNRKTLREECWFVWHSFTRQGRGKYSLNYPWSPAAIAAHNADAKAALRIEHVEPFTIFCARLEKLAHGSSSEVESLLNDIVLVVITADEDAEVTRSGCRQSLAPGSTDPWDRYRSIGLTRESFVIPATGERLQPAKPETIRHERRGDDLSGLT